MALANTDLDKIDNIITNKLNRFKEDVFEEIDNKLHNLKSEFFERIDPILKEVITSREERPLIENRIEALEEIHQNGQHSLAN